MNLWFRLIFVLVSSFNKSRILLLDKCSMRFTVLPSDLDLNFHLTNAGYYAIADLGRIDFVVRTGLASAALRMRGRPIIGDSMAKFRKDLRPFQRFELETQLLGWDDKWAFIEHRFCRKGRVVGVVLARCLFANSEGAMPPKDILTAAECWQESPQIPAWVRAWSLACDSLASDIRHNE